jgi:predicted component of type VI protein secretion system
MQSLKSFVKKYFGKKKQVTPEHLAEKLEQSRALVEEKEALLEEWKAYNQSVRDMLILDSEFLPPRTEYNAMSQVYAQQVEELTEQITAIHDYVEEELGHVHLNS